ncbi:MAG: Crp/Fnr family transcriptional regulator [Bacteroidetes bacterium]|nr:Crp/Fnr family transcriptional regulator [Bacteroidota bacterium]
MPFEVLFTNVSENEKTTFLKNQQLLTFEKNKIIFEQKSKVEGVFHVNKGTLKRFINGLDGKECIFDICGQGDVFGHRNIFINEENFDSCVSMTDVELIFIPKEDFILFLNKSQAANMNYIRLVSQESIRHIKHGQILSQLSLRQRMAYYLLYILQKNKNVEQPIIEISRDDLANLLGTVKESAVRTLQEFKQEGALMASGRKIYISNQEVLRKATRMKDELV